jgi:hypothetical protein
VRLGAQSLAKKTVKWQIVVRRNRTSTASLMSDTGAHKKYGKNANSNGTVRKEQLRASTGREQTLGPAARRGWFANPNGVSCKIRS